MDNFDLKKYLAEGRLLKEDLIDKIKKLKDYNKTEDSLKYEKYDITYDKDENLYSVFLKKGSGDSSDMPEFESSNPEKVKKYLTENKLTPNSRINEEQATKELIDFGKEVQSKLQTINDAFKFKINVNAGNFNLFDKLAATNTGGFAILGQGEEMAIITHKDNKQVLQDVISKFTIAKDFDAALDDSSKKSISDTSYEISTKPGVMYFTSIKPGVIDTNGVSKVFVGVNGRGIREK
jgi:hypothetical protein